MMGDFQELWSSSFMVRAIENQPVEEKKKLQKDLHSISTLQDDEMCYPAHKEVEWTSVCLK